MSHGPQREPDLELDLGLEPPPAPVTPPLKKGLTIKRTTSQPLSPAQEEFNKRMKALEKARAAHERKRACLDADLVVCRDELMPIVEMRNRVEHQLVLLAMEARKTLKLTVRRRKALDDLISLKIEDLLDDPVGFSEEEIAVLETQHEELNPRDSDGGSVEEEEFARTRFEAMREMLEDIARDAGVKLDLSGLDPHMDPAELDRLMHERFAAAEEEFKNSSRDPFSKSGAQRKRKPSKAALERARLKKEAEEAKNRDFKALYKQLAKVLHPDLETDPELKAHKEAWMKRLTTARANGDLREMLAIEMEWLGEEAGNLTQATDDKLRVYAMVLKEQLAELKERTNLLSLEPEYLPLRRFLQPFGDYLDAAYIKKTLQEEIGNIEHMATTLRAGGDAARKMVNQWADHHARAFAF
jgi:hypothetical protein